MYSRNITQPYATWLIDMCYDSFTCNTTHHMKLNDLFICAKTHVYVTPRFHRYATWCVDI